MLLDLALVGEDVDDVAHVHAIDVGLEGQGAGVLHGVEEDGGDGAADADGAELLVGHARVLVAHEPEDRIRRGLARGAGADDVADVREWEALRLELLDLLLAVGDAVALVLQHGQRVQRDVGAGPGVLQKCTSQGI